MVPSNAKPVFVATLVAVLCAGSIATATANLSVQIVNPAASPSVGYVDLRQPFEATAYLDGVELDEADLVWTWDFGDGSPSSMENPTTHVYQSEGSYVVVVTVSLNGTQAQALATVSVSALQNQIPGWIIIPELWYPNTHALDGNADLPGFPDPPCRAVANAPDAHIPWGYVSSTAECSGKLIVTFKKMAPDAANLHVLVQGKGDYSMAGTAVCWATLVPADQDGNAAWYQAWSWGAKALSDVTSSCAIYDDATSQPLAQGDGMNDWDIADQGMGLVASGPGPFEKTYNRSLRYRLDAMPVVLTDTARFEMLISADAHAENHGFLSMATASTTTSGTMYFTPSEIYPVP